MNKKLGGKKLAAEMKPFAQMKEEVADQIDEVRLYLRTWYGFDPKKHNDISLANMIDALRMMLSLRAASSMMRLRNGEKEIKKVTGQN